MRKSFHILFEVAFLISLCQTVNGQLLSVGTESELTILGGTDFAVDQLVLVPARDYSISNNNLSVSKHKLFNTGKSVSKTYLFDQNPVPFYGKVMVAVDQSESIPEMSIQLFDNFHWNAVETKQSLFNRQLLEGQLIAGSITKAITVGQTAGKGDFEIITNPAINKVVTIKINRPGEYQFISPDGKLLMNQKFSEGMHRVDLSRYAHATYKLTNRSTTKTLIL